MSQFEMFAPPVREAVPMPSADSVRPKLEAVLRQLRDRTAERWSAAERRRWGVVFPQMCEWLPTDERDPLLAEFRRLTLLATAPVEI